MIGSVPFTSIASASAWHEFPLASARVLALTVANDSVYVQLGRGVGGLMWEPADPGSGRIPGVHTIPGPCDAIRVRSAAAHAGTTADPWPTIAVDAY